MSDAALTPELLEDMHRRVAAAREYRSQGVTVAHITLEQAETLLAALGDWEPVHAAPFDQRCPAQSGDQCVHYADSAHEHEADMRQFGHEAPVVAQRLRIDIVHRLHSPRPDMEPR